jgi:hypothetical protein
VAGKPPGAKDLVKACLTVDPTKRATAQTVLAHPWINGNAPDVAIDIGNLRKFQAARKLKAVRFAPTPGPPAPHASAHYGAHPGQPRPCPPHASAHHCAPPSSPQAAAKIMAMRSAGIANLARAALAAEQAK